MNDYFGLLHHVMCFGQDVETRGLKTKELIGENLKLVSCEKQYNVIYTEEHRPWDQVRNYLYPELAWYLSGDRTLTKIRPYSKFWDKITNPDGTINSNYGDLVFYRKNVHAFTSFEWAFCQLFNDQFTRKAIVLYNDRDFFFPENRDLICNQYQQFLIRNNKLICLVALRSSDMIYGLTFNMPWWSLVHQHMYLRLKQFEEFKNLQLGEISAFLGSVHVYENKFELANNMLISDTQNYKFLRLKRPIALGRSFEEYMEIIPEIYCEDVKAVPNSSL